MKYVRQFAIILGISCLGELLHVLLPLPVPASVYGLVLMLFFLCSGILRTEQVKEAAVFLIDIMPVLFIPAGVGLIVSWKVLKPICIPVLVITLLTTILVMAVTGRITQHVIRRGSGRKEKRR